MNPFAVDYARFRRKFGRCYERSFDELRAEARLTRMQAELLLFLYDFPILDSAADFVRESGGVKSNVSVSVEGLARAGLLSRRADDRNRRQIHLGLTDAGAAMAKRLSDCRSDFLKGALCGVSEPCRRELEQLLQQLLINVEKTK